jgi:hypothetical protein
MSVMLSRIRLWWLFRRKRAALVAYVFQLGDALEKAYGRSETYSIGRIRRALRAHGLSLKYEMHALAMFASRIDFAETFKATFPSEKNSLQQCDNLRREVAEIANDGSYQFLPKHREDIGMDNGRNSDAAARWGVGLH